MSEPYDDALADMSVTCHSYTHARRYPLVIGKIGEFTLPTPLSPAQISTLLASFFFLLVTRGLWGGVLPRMVNVFILIVVPLGMTWAVRHLRMEGRSPVKMLIGLVSYWAAPRHGWSRGSRIWTRPHPQRLVQPILIVPAPAGVRTRVERPRRRAAVADLKPAPRWAALDDKAA